APAGDGNAEKMDSDPSIDQLAPAYTATINQYLRTELDYSTDAVYEILPGRVHPRSYKEFAGRAVEVASELARALRTSPPTGALGADGCQGAAAPFAASVDGLAQLAIPREECAEGIGIEYYEAGHMVYCHVPSRVAMSRHLEEFVAGAEPTAEAETEAGTAGTPDAEPGSPESDAEDA